MQAPPRSQRLNPLAASKVTFKFYRVCIFQIFDLFYRKIGEKVIISC